MLLVDERCLQADLLGADRIVPVASVAASGDLDASASTQRAATQLAAATNVQQHRPSGICRVVSAGTWRAGRCEDRQAGDRDPLASRRLPSVLALEIKTAQWASKDPAGNPSAHSRDQSRQPIMGRTTASWRASQARHRCRTNHRCKVYGKGKATAVPGGKTFLHNHADGVASMDLFVVPTISFRLLYGLLILHHDRRQILGLGVTAHPTAEWISQQLTEAYGWKVAPRYIIRDRDAVYGDVFIRRLRAMSIRDRPTAPRSPWQNGYCERAIGSIRRECLDHVVVFGERHLRHLLRSYASYYNRASEHPSGYVIDEKRFCWLGCDPAGYFGFCRARSVMD